MLYSLKIMFTNNKQEQNNQQNYTIFTCKILTLQI